MEKIDALKQYLKKEENYSEAELKKVEVSSYDPSTFTTDDREYMVLTEAEADYRAKEYIRDSVWAFNLDFIINHSQVLDYDTELLRSMQDIQASQCENCNELFKRLIDDMDEFVNDAIYEDGRAHFLNTYDDEEHELGEYFIYRI